MRPRRSCRGESLVEMALAIPIVIIMSLGVVQFGFIYFINSSVENAAREGARYGAIHPTPAADITQKVKDMLTGIDTTSPDFSVQVTYPDGPSTPPNRIRVTVTYPLTAAWPAPGPATYTTAATMRIEKEG